MENQSHFGLSEFMERFHELKVQDEVFSVENSRFLTIRIDGRVWIKVGSMVAYRGDVRFGRESDFAFAEGKGTVFCADQGKKISIISLGNESLFAQGNSLLAFERSLKHGISMVKGRSGLLKGGHYCVQLEGSGKVVISTHDDPIVMKCNPLEPVFTDPDSTVAWSGSIHPEVIVEAGVHSLFKGGSGEINKYLFQGDGFVIVQPFEEHSYSPATGLHAKT